MLVIVRGQLRLELENTNTLRAEKEENEKKINNLRAEYEETEKFTQERDAWFQ